ncbi:MAG TPA: hypothetical protein VJ772_09945 [Nitrososphaeraceae archaeon]|nr:hypothetical protein [Nitrososphaeraceae archaeon]
MSYSGSSEFTQTGMYCLVILGIMLLGESSITYGQSDSINEAPVIQVTLPIAGEINQTVLINASISDPDGNTTSIIWNQESEPPAVNMNISNDRQSMSFVPRQNTTYVFSIEAIDNNGSAVLKPVSVEVGDQ